MMAAYKKRAVSEPGPGSIAPAPPLVPDDLERRVNGLVRVPFIRRCLLSFDDGTADEAFLVNINVLGAYVARDHLPQLGQGVSCKFGVPGNERPVALEGVVAWVNARQQHPVHSLPPGFGLKFRDVAPEDIRRIQQVIADYVETHPRR